MALFKPSFYSVYLFGGPHTKKERADENRKKNRFQVPKGWLMSVLTEIYLSVTSAGLWVIVYANISAEISCNATGKQAIYQGEPAASGCYTFNVDWGEEYLPIFCKS